MVVDDGFQSWCESVINNEFSILVNNGRQRLSIILVNHGESWLFIMVAISSSLYFFTTVVFHTLQGLLQWLSALVEFSC